MIKRLFYVSILGLFLGITLIPFNSVDAEEEVLKGEILDMACFLAKEKRGEAHKKCALNCVEHGQPMGLIDGNGKIYLLLADHDNPDPFGQAKKLAGTLAEIKGSILKKDNLEGVVITSVKASD